MSDMEQVLQNLGDIWQEWWQGFQESIPQIVAGVIVLLISVWLARLVASLARRGLQRRKADPELALLLTRLVNWTLIILGVVLALDQAGQDVGALIAGLGILGFTIGFALQDVSKNFIAGILLLIQQPFDIGDSIEVAGYGGTVEEIDLRATSIRTFDGLLVSIPNGDVFTSPIVNYTRVPMRRLQISVGVAYDSDLDLARETARQTIAAIPGVLADPAPDLRFEEFGDSAITLTIFYWYDAAQTGYSEALDGGISGIKRAFDQAGIEIPFPVRILYSKNGE